jgi:N-6 DNA Methylase
MIFVVTIAALIAAQLTELLDLLFKAGTSGGLITVVAGTTLLGGVLVKKSLNEAISHFGTQATAKLKNVAITGAPEEQLRKPLEDLIEDLAVATGMIPKSVGLVGETTLSGLQIRPDFAVTVNKQLIGFIEVKRLGKGSDPRKFSDDHDKGQWKKLQSLPNLLYTDGNSFSLWRSGELQGKVIGLEGDVETSGAKLVAPDTLLPLISDFLRWAPESPKTAEQLARICAKLCRLLRDEVTEQMVEGNKGLTLLAADWRKLLFPDATDERFADGYAQAVTFGLLMARAYNIPLDKGIEVVALELRKTNSLIGTALRLLTDDPANQEALKTSLGTLMRVLNVVDWTKISKGKPEAWLTFYEDFLQVYDNSLRKQTGSYYTPPEVVDTMVRLVDEALKGPLFKRSLGIASSDVTIADPAVGTGTFLLGVLRKIADNVRVDQGEGSVPNAVKAAAERLFGFELQFGPFAVAQLRLLAEMRALIHPDEDKEKDKAEGKAPPAIPDLHLFVTDTLSNPFVEEESFSSMEAAIAQSKRDANKVKRGQPIMVVIGNPPYKNKAAGLGSWIEDGSAGRPAAMDWWTPPVNWGAGAHTHHLKNLYVYFWRWAALKVFGSGWNAATGEADTDRHGLVCFITVAGFLNGPGFAKMRAELRRDCSEIWVIDCSPDGHQPDVPTRIFQGVQQPVCIVLAARKAGKDKDKPAKLKFCALPEGKRDGKFAALKTLSLKSGDWQEGPSGWREPFLPELSGGWAEFVNLTSIFAWSGPGVTPHRTWPISPDAQSLEKRWVALKKEKDVAKAAILFSNDDDRSIERVVRLDLPTRHVR